jgi:hypothetical protein
MHAAINSEPKTRSSASLAARLLNIGLWLLQVLLAALFAWHGQLMAFPPTEMVAMIDANIGPNLRVFIGVAELLAAVGLLLPGITRILPSLTPLAAGGLMIPAGQRCGLHPLEGAAHPGAQAGLSKGYCLRVSPA